MAFIVEEKNEVATFIVAIHVLLMRSKTTKKKVLMSILINTDYQKLSWLILMSILVIKNKKNIDAYLTLEF